MTQQPNIPVITVDSREQTPLAFQKLRSIRGTLTTGDYSVSGLEHLFSVERKSIPDLVGCCTGDNRERFERELHRLRGFRFKRLLIVGSRLEIEQHRYVSSITPAAVLGSLSAWEVRFDCPAVFAATPAEAASLVERWAHYFSREVTKDAAALTTASDPQP